MLGSEPIDGSRGASQTSGGKKGLIVGIANDQSIAWAAQRHSAHLSVRPDEPFQSP